MTIPWWGLIPFIVMLLSIAVLPLIPATAHHWEKNSTKLALSLVLGIPVIAWMAISFGAAPVLHSSVEYLSFIALLASLFVVSGGIFVDGDIEATPRNNTIFLALGAILASFIGTTGAAMLLIRPILNTNRERAHKTHTVLFVIMVVANCGGLLTPLGDPPLFLGYLAGVPFTWTFSLFPEWLFVNALLLVTYFGLDSKMYAKERPEDIRWDKNAQRPIRIRGGLNFVWFAIIVGSVAFNIPSIDVHAIEHGTATAVSWIPWRELVLCAAAVASYVTTNKKIRFRDNEFSWEPIGEVAFLFIGIFATMIPALLFLEEVSGSLPLNTLSFFGFTGLLSGFLDNAPTYKTFFEMGIAANQAHPTGLDVLSLGGSGRTIPLLWLEAISLGAVFCGALTYIGNGPNFMVKSVAESRGVKMPSFGHYILKTLRYLAPVLVAMALLFLTNSLIPQLIGVGIVLIILAEAWANLSTAAKLTAGLPDDED